MRRFIYCWSLLVWVTAAGQSRSTISVLDFVKIKNNKEKEALYYYENNWKAYRDIAVKKKFITSYQLMTTKADSLSNFDIILITEYPDSVALSLSEERFQKIIKDIRPDGPRLLNEIKPNDFRQILFGRKAQTTFYSSRKRK